MKNHRLNDRETISFVQKGLSMQMLPTNKEEQFDVLREEFHRERAAVLGKAGFAVESALAKLDIIQRQFEEKVAILNSIRENPENRRTIFEEINTIVDQFNTAWQKADRQYYYLIVTREAMGLRRHETVQQFYCLPPKKKKIQAF